MDHDGSNELVAPLRFAVIERGLYRSAYPTLRNFDFLRTLELKTIVSIIPNDATLDLREFCRAKRISHRQVSVDKYKEGEVAILPNDASQVLEIALNPANFPLLIHCLDGRANTGTVVLLLRRLLLWSTSAAHAEYCRFTKEPSVPTDINGFVAEFPAPINLPSSVPRWFWNGSLVDRDGKPQRHPTMRVKNPATLTAISRAAAPQDAVLVVKMLTAGARDTEVRRDGDHVEIGGEMRMLGSVATGAAAATRSGLFVSHSMKEADRRLTEAKPRSRSADAQSRRR
jgi:tyrosine-protein phosphatase OCA6